MFQNLDEAITNWLNGFAKEWDTSIDDFVDEIGLEEFENREGWYPQLCDELQKPDLDVVRIREISSNCFTLCFAQDSIRLNNYLNNQDAAASEISTLLNDFPKSDEEAIIRINNFVEKAPELGYVNKNGNSDWAGAAQFASVLLSSVYPDRFVDFRMERWKNFVESLNYDISLPNNNARGGNYGEKLIWAGKFAIDFSKTDVFQKYWLLQSYPLWRVASLSWFNQNSQKPSIPNNYNESAGHVWDVSTEIKKHRKREDAKIVRLAKEQRLKTDPLLRCEVCNFSFKEAYGHLGYKFIEGHHQYKQVCEIAKGDETNIDDIALVCSNCHSMIHRGKRVNGKRVFLTIEELRDLIFKQKGY